MLTEQHDRHTSIIFSGSLRRTNPLEHMVKTSSILLNFKLRSERKMTSEDALPKTQQKDESNGFAETNNNHLYLSKVNKVSSGVAVKTLSKNVAE